VKPSTAVETRTRHGSAGSSLDNRFVPPSFITLHTAGGHLSFGILESYQKTLLAIVTSIVASSFSGAFSFIKWPHLASAYITGISVGILLRSPALWPYILCALLSITSKYVLRVKGRHIWNPSNFGISAMLFLAADAVATLSIQWGNYLCPMLVIWLLGSDHLASAALSHLRGMFLSFLSLSRSASAHHRRVRGNRRLLRLQARMYQLFIFFMITDPKTTVRSQLGQCVVILSWLPLKWDSALIQVVYAPFYALFVCGPSGYADRDVAEFAPRQRNQN
jgi:hypothetical protein